MEALANRMSSTQIQDEEDGSLRGIVPGRSVINFESSHDIMFPRLRPGRSIRRNIHQKMERVNEGPKSTLNTSSDDTKIKEALFHLFSALPRELRQKIWMTALTQRLQDRKITISEIATHRVLTEKVTANCETASRSSLLVAIPERSIQISSGPLPRLLLTCKEVLEAGLFEPMKVKSLNRNSLYSPIFDTVVLSPTDEAPSTTLSQIMSSETLGRIRHLEFAGDLSHPVVADWFVTNIKDMSSLSSLSIRSDGLVTPGFTAPPNINMRFQSFSVLDEGWSLGYRRRVFVPRCTVDGQEYFGGDAINAISHRVTEEAESCRFIQMWGFLNSITSNCYNLPASITVVIEYTVLAWSNDPDFPIGVSNGTYSVADVIDGLVTLE